MENIISEILKIIRKDDASGLWEYLKDQFADLKTIVMDAIMDIIQSQVIQAGIKWVMGLLTPVGAFIKAAMAIIDVVKFFIQRAAQIMELVKAFTDSIKAIASGNVGAVAKSIENALGRAPAAARILSCGIFIFQTFLKVFIFMKT
ncbi:hypothetical protein ACFQO9_19955 [Chryseobacterium zhengzhouense]|uniref:Uncharacterized protein n=1 Tax=Chryseobacterium zhengzhouense TaxID=1636086 RepID=A0ABW2M429_9FLAO